MESFLTPPYQARDAADKLKCIREEIHVLAFAVWRFIRSCTIRPQASSITGASVVVWVAPHRGRNPKRSSQDGLKAIYILLKFEIPRQQLMYESGEYWGSKAPLQSHCRDRHYYYSPNTSASPRGHNYIGEQDIIDIGYRHWQLYWDSGSLYSSTTGPWWGYKKVSGTFSIPIGGTMAKEYRLYQHADSCEP